MAADNSEQSSIVELQQTIFQLRKEMDKQQFEHRENLKSEHVKMLQEQIQLQETIRSMHETIASLKTVNENQQREMGLFKRQQNADYEQQLKELQKTIQTLHQKMNDQQNQYLQEIRELKNQDRVEIEQLHNTINLLRDNLEANAEK